VSEVIVLELSVYRNLVHYYVDVHFVNTLIRVKNAFYRNYNCDHNLVNNSYFVNTLTLDFYDY